jgi:HEAT repeat protein
MLIATVIVLVILFFGEAGKESRTLEALLRDMETGSAHSRKQDAFQVTQLVNERCERSSGKDRYLSMPETELLLKLARKHQDEGTVTQWMVYALGRVGQPAVAVPALVDLADAAPTSAEVRTYAVESLGLTQALEAVEPLLRVLQRFSAPEDWELRWRAVRSLSQIQSARGTTGERPAKALQGCLGDPRREISWSAGVYLTGLWKDPSGLPVVRRLLDWEYLDAQRGDRRRELTHKEKESWKQLALEALYRLDGEGAVAVVTACSKDDRSLRVRNTALKILAERGSGPRPNASESRKPGP